MKCEKAVNMDRWIGTKGRRGYKETQREGVERAAGEGSVGEGW